MSGYGGLETLERLREDSEYVDSLINLFPPKVFLGIQSENAPSNYLHGTTAKAAAKRESKEYKKKAKRLKLDPASAQTTIEIQETRIKKTEEQKEANVESQETTAEKPVENGVDNFWSFGQAVSHATDQSGRSGASIEELRERLQKRLDSFRAARKADDTPQKSTQPKQSQKGKKGKGKKSKQPDKPLNKSNEVEKHEVQPEKVPAATNPQGELSLQFGKIEGGDKSFLKHSKKPKKAKTSQLLAKAAALQEQLSKASQTGEEEKILKHTWSAAVGRASGKKVLDDPKLLKKKMQKENSKRKKSAKSWNERRSHQDAANDAKQKKRKDNLQQRIDKKKQTKITKREKKLMRPGFEGRVGSVINKTQEDS